MTLQRWARSLRALQRGPADEPGGLPFTDLYPNLRPVGIRSRAYPPVRFVGATLDSTIVALANPARTMLEITNAGAANLYLTHGPAASALSYTAKLPPGAIYVLEGPDVYQGDVAGLWDAVSGAAQVTEAT